MDRDSIIHDNLEIMLQDRSSAPCKLPFEYLKMITDDFSDKRLLGEGGFGKVYKGVLQNGKMIAVKKLYQLKPGILGRQFENEVYHLMRLNHPNIVSFVGYCYETHNECVEHEGKYVFAEMQQRLLCLEYLPNQSLEGRLSDESSGLDWHTRYKIIKGVCCGLYYLHEECQSQINASIIHLDLKPANILLDDNMKPKIADFGLSKLFIDKKTHTCVTTLLGSLGYMAPEYICNHLVTTKADIYSLGVIIIEIITGGKIDLFNFDIATSRRDFVEPVLKNWRNRLEAAPKCASLETDYQQIEICLEIGISCIMFDPKERPAIGRIIKILNKWENTSCYVNDVERPFSDKISEPKELLLIRPIRLHFFLDPMDRVICLVKLFNMTDDNVVFHFGVTKANSLYNIEPNTGLLLPGSTFNIDVQIYVSESSLADEFLASSLGDEFLVQSATIQRYNAISKPITADMFNNMPKDMVHKVKLTVCHLPSLRRNEFEDYVEPFRERWAESLPVFETLPRGEAIGGYIFVCNNDTMEENLKRQLFGLPSRYRDSVRAIRPGLPLFLYNYSTHQLHGIFEAASFGGSNIDPTAWEDKKCPGESRFPAQVHRLSS